MELILYKTFLGGGCSAEAVVLDATRGYTHFLIVNESSECKHCVCVGVTSFSGLPGSALKKTTLLTLARTCPVL